MRLSKLALVVAGCTGSVGTAQAADIPMSNPDLEMRWDNTLRYNAGWRVKDRDPSLANNPANDEAEFLFDKGDMINNRLDLYSELDVSYQKRVGARVSGALWYDERYGDTGRSHPLLADRASYPGNRFSSYIKRYYSGPSGEFLDAFVWGNFMLGETDLALKLGRHAQLWGEAVFPTASANSVAFAQAPSDGLKSSTSPGATAKESTIPMNQLTGTWQLTDRLSVSGLYTLEWRESRVPEGGTFLGLSDALLKGPVRLAPGVPWGDPEEGEKGDWGVTVRWRPSFMDEPNLGLYYRKFDDKGPSWAAQQVQLPGSPLEARTVHARDIEVWGVSIGTTVMGHALGAEVSHRRNTPLLSASPRFTAPSDFEGARGDTWHFLVNSASLFGKSKFFDSAALIMELTYQKLDKVTKNKAHFRSAATMPGACGVETIVKGCATDDAWHFALLFNPSWLQVFPSTDLSMPIVFQTGLDGNAATGGINEGASVFRIGLAADYRLRHKVELAYTNYWGKSKDLGQVSPAGSFVTTNGALAAYKDRDNVTLTYTFSF